MNQQQDRGNVTIFEMINSICRRFQRAWKSGTRARIEDLLPQIIEDGRPNLFSNRLQLEKTIREKRGGRPGSREYIERFPEYAGLIRQAFFESTQMSLEGGPEPSLCGK